MKLKLALALALLTAACGTSSKETLTKSEAQALIDSGEASDDVCTSNGFNEDDVCDDWCPDGDTTDCETSNSCTDGERKEVDCNTCACTDGAWACTEIACGGNNEPDGPLQIEIGECPPDGDAISITNVSVKGDELDIDVGFSGGCADHTVTACWDGSFLESNPVQAQIKLHHDANGDMCEAYLMQTLTYDLTPLKDAYEAGYPGTDGIILISVPDAPEGARYEF